MFASAILSSKAGLIGSALSGLIVLTATGGAIVLTQKHSATPPLAQATPAAAPAPAALQLPERPTPQPAPAPVVTYTPPSPASPVIIPDSKATSSTKRHPGAHNKHAEKSFHKHKKKK